MTGLQEATCLAIVNIFETGSPEGHYGAVTVVAGDAGNLTYGRSQASLASGNLYRLIALYCAEPHASDAAELKVYLPRLQARDVSLNHDVTLKAILRGAGDDPVMHRVQDDFFRTVFLVPAMAAAARHGLTAALSQLAVYDNMMQGPWPHMLEQTLAAIGPVSVRYPEHAWVAEYIKLRQEFLSKGKAPLPLSVYRTEALTELVEAGNWDLDLPFKVRGYTLTAESLAQPTPLPSPRIYCQPGPSTPPEEQGSSSSAAPGDEYATLEPAIPYPRNEAVRALQTALNAHGIAAPSDGIFGPYTQVLLQQFQQKQGLIPSAVADSETWTALLAPADLALDAPR